MIVCQSYLSSRINESSLTKIIVNRKLHRTFPWSFLVSYFRFLKDNLNWISCIYIYIYIYNYNIWHLHSWSIDENKYNIYKISIYIIYGDYVKFSMLVHETPSNNRFWQVWVSLGTFFQAIHLARSPPCIKTMQQQSAESSIQILIFHLLFSRFVPGIFFVRFDFWHTDH